MRKFFTFLLALAASVGMMNAKVTWNSSNISDLNVMGTNASYSKEGVTLSANADQIYAMWYSSGDESMTGIGFNANATGGFTFSNTLGKNFTKIEMLANRPGGWDYANLGSGWSFPWISDWDSPVTITWTGNASTVDLLKEASNFNGEYVKSIVFYFEGDSEEATTAVTGVTLNKSAAEMTVGGATLTLIPTVLPSNATNKDVMWTSSNSNVATVNNGVVTAVGPGTANITVSTVDGNKSATCVVTVSNPAPTYTVALKAGTANADKVTLSATSAVEGATVTVTPNEEYEITDFSAYYVVVEDQLGSIYEIDATLDPGTGAYSFTMPAYAVTIEATIALKPVPEGDIFANFTATAGSGGFANEGHANLVDNKFISSNWTKWCANDGHKSVPTGESGDACWWIDFEADAALNLTGYILTTGNDTGSEHGRNPKNWLLKAKLNAGDAWTTIATVTNDVTMKNQSFKDYKFFVDQSGPYQYFRFEVFANQGAGVMQLCELRLIGTEASEPAPATPDWVRDGDTWDDATKTLTVNSNTGDNAYASKTDIKHLIVSDAVTELGWGTFFFDSLMTTVELGNNLEIIGISAFNECRSLSTITVPASVTNIKVRAFRNCTSLTTFTCEAVTPPTIGNAIFENDNNLTAIYVPAASVEAYKTAWSDYASLIKAIGGGSAPAYTVALEDGTVNADKVTLSATSAVEGATITVTPDEEYEITAFSAYYVVVEDQLGSIYEIDATLDPGTGAYSFTMPAANVTIEATIAEKAAPAPATTVTWNSSNISNLVVSGSSYSQEGVTLGANASNNYAYWLDYGDESQNGIYFYVNATGGHTFSNSLGKNFTKIEMTLNGSTGWYVAYLGSGWNIDGMKAIWTGNASTVDLLTETSSFGGAAGVKSIVFYFEGDSEEPGGGSTPTTWTALKVGDVIKVGDKIEVPAEGDGSWGINGNVLRNAWGPYTLILADIYQASEFDDPVVTETEDGAFYVFKAENSDFYPLSNLGKGTGLVVTTTSDGLVVTAAENKDFTVAVHENGSDPTAVENVQTNEVQTTKILRNGQLYIMYKGTMYNVQGARVK